MTTQTPIDAARDWLTDPARAPQLPEALLAYVHDSLLLAEEHYRDLDLLAGEIAYDARSTHDPVDLTRVAVVDRMVGELQQFSMTLRAVLDDAEQDPELVERRLAGGLEAGRTGGLRSFLTAM